MKFLKHLKKVKNWHLKLFKEIGQFIDTATGEVFATKQEGKKLAPQTVLRKLFSVIGVKYSSRNGGYTRIFRLPPRRGDASEMALIQLV